MLNFLILFAGIVLVVVGSMGVFGPKPAEVAAATATLPVGESEVSDLIARLKPLAKEPNSRWSGLEVSFSGADVSIKLKTKDENEYHGTAKTLKDAVSRIADPSAPIREALKGWSDRR